MANEYVVSDINFAYRIELGAVCHVHHIHRSVVANKRAHRQSNVVADAGVGGISDFGTGQNRYVVAHRVQDAVVLQQAGPVVTTGSTDSIIKRHPPGVAVSQSRGDGFQKVRHGMCDEKLVAVSGKVNSSVWAVSGAEKLENVVHRIEILECNFGGLNFAAGSVLDELNQLNHTHGIDDA